MANYSRWDDIKNKRPAPSAETRVEVEHDLALGQLIYEGLIDDFRTPLLMGTLLSILLALVADLTLAGVQRLAVPWART